MVTNKTKELIHVSQLILTKPRVVSIVWNVGKERGLR